MPKKKQFHCQECGQPCTIYKKGKSHRVLVCPTCGIIASNPTVLGKVLRRGARAVVGEIPFASAIMEGVGLVNDLVGEPKKRESKKKAITGEEYRVGRSNFEKALMLEAIER